MKERRTKIMKRLVLEELERRAMLAGPPVIAMASTGLTNNSYEDFYKAQMGTEIGGPAGVGMVDSTTAMANMMFAARANTNAAQPISLSPLAITGTGQMTITTGANTLGIGSFAMPIAGPSRAGGTGNVLGRFGDGSTEPNPAATDAAIQSLFSEPDDETADKIADESKRATQVSDRTASEYKTSRRSFDIESDGEDAWKREPAGVE